MTTSEMEKVEMRGSQAVVYLSLTLLSGVSCAGRSQCCASISVTSSAVGENYQSHQLGVYSLKENLTVHGRPVYKQVSGDQYFYYWVG